MIAVKINNKKYTVKELEFSDMTHMEDMGFSVLEMLDKHMAFSLAAAFVGVVVKCDRQKAEELCQQHVLGGGQLRTITDAFQDAMNESAFFKKFLGDAKDSNQEEEQKTEA